MVQRRNDNGEDLETEGLREEENGRMGEYDTS